MKAFVRYLVASNLGWRLLAGSRQPGCIVLMYHRVGEPGDVFPNLDIRQFRLQVAWLLRNCTIISPDQLPLGEPSRDTSRPSVALTFDDGYRGYYDHVYPLLKAQGVRAANFLATDFVDRPRLAWWDQLFLALRATTKRAARLPWGNSPEFNFAQGDRDRFLAACKAGLKLMQNAEKEVALRRIWEGLDVDPDSMKVSRQTMNWDEVRATRDLTTFGGHTHTHPLLSKVDREFAEREIATCHRRLLEELGEVPRLFAYPSGNFNDTVKALVRQQGFDVAFSTIPGINGSDTDWFAVRRIAAAQSVPELAWAISRMSGLGGWEAARRR